MKYAMLLMIGILFLVGCTQTVTDEVDNVGVQAAMDSFVQARLAESDGVYAVGDVDTEFDYLHDGVSEKDGLFVSCADFKSGDSVYDVDYYVKEENGQYEVVKEVFHKLDGEEVNEVLWEK